MGGHKERDSLPRSDSPPSARGVPFWSRSAIAAAGGLLLLILLYILILGTNPQSRAPAPLREFRVVDFAVSASHSELRCDALRVTLRGEAINPPGRVEYAILAAALRDGIPVSRSEPVSGDVFVSEDDRFFTISRIVRLEEIGDHVRVRVTLRNRETIARTALVRTPLRCRARFAPATPTPAP